MSSKIKLNNNSLGGTEFELEHETGAPLIQVKTTDLLGTVAVASITDLENRVGTDGDIAHLTGAGGQNGKFVYDSNAGTPNGGTIFGKWVREYDGAVNVKWFGANETRTDNEVPIQAAIDTKIPVVLDNKVYKVSNTINLGSRARSLSGLSKQRRESTESITYAKILYVGIASSTTAVVLLGQNDVGAEPSSDTSSITLENLIIDANDLAGFGVYGTYITNESSVENITIQGSTEYNAYFCRSWYAEFNSITSLACRWNGLAFGMPLIYSDGTDVSSSWVTPSPLEMNNTKIDNIRSISSGEHYSIDNPSTYDPTNSAIRMTGYGIGAGIGNSFNMKTFTSESCGGVGLYCYTDAQPIKNLKGGYFEGNCKNSGLDAATTNPQMILDSVGTVDGLNIEDVYVKYESGGIYHTGVTTGITRLNNIYQPRFLKSLDGVSTNDLYSFVLKEQVYSACGLNNTREDLMYPNGYGDVDLTVSSGIDFPPTIGRTAIYAKEVTVGAVGWYFKIQEDGTVIGPEELPALSSSWTLLEITTADIVRIARNSGTGTVTFKVLSVPTTYQ